MSRNTTTTFILCLMLGLLLVGCGSESNSPNNDAAANPQQPITEDEPDVPDESLEPALPLNADGEQIVATVNGEEITLRDFEQTFTRTQLETDSASYDALAAAVLNTMIEQVLINQAAAEMDISVPAEVVETELQASRELVEDHQAWEQWLADNLFTEEEFRVSLEEALLTQRVRDSVATVETTPVSQVHARHILVSTETEAQAVLTRLNAGEDFAALAADLSRDVTTREQGGDLGWFTEADLLTPELAAVAFETQPNEIAGPVETILGYHVIQTLEFGQREALPDEQSARAANQFNEWLQQQVEQATIERYIN